MKTAVQNTENQTTVQLRCPSCDKTVDVNAHDQVEGASVSCRHCGLDPVLTREFEEHTGKSHWILEDPDADDATADRR